MIVRSTTWVIAMTAVTVCSRTVTAQETTPVDASAEPETEHSFRGWILGLDASAIALAEAGILVGTQPDTCVDMAASAPPAGEARLIAPGTA